MDIEREQLIDMKFEYKRKTRLLIGGSIVVVVIVLALLAWLNTDKRITTHPPRLPYPDAKAALSLQKHVNDSLYTWYTDVKAAASSFCNQEIHSDSSISTENITVLEESMFHARVEVRLAPKKSIILTMERPFKEKADKSIWQVTKVEDKK